MYNSHSILYDYEQRDKEVMVTDSTYYADKNVFVYINNSNAPDYMSTTKYYASDDDKLFIVQAYLLMNKLYFRVLYYDGGFIGIANWSLDDQTELSIPYDLEQMQPESFEDLLTEASYDTYFTYDGTDVEFH